MSKNTITSYFKPVSVSKDPKPVSRKRPIIVSDDDEPIETVAPKRSKKNEKKSRQLSDSDESPKKKPVNNEKTKKVEKVVSTKELFGKTPIKRVAAPKVERKLKEPVKTQPKVPTKEEAEYHDDAEFENALEQLDTTIPASPTSNGTNEPDKKVQRSPEKNAKKTSEIEDEKPSKKRKVENEVEKLNLAKLKKPESPKKSDVKKETRSSPGKTKDKKADETATSSKTPYKLEVEKHSPKKKKDDQDPLQKVVEKKKQTAALYNQYLHRGGAKNPGSKEIPEGADYCLAGLRFLLTGIYDSLEREEAGELIQKYGGTIIHAVSKKLDYLVVGSEAGPAKITKAESLKIKQINEDELLELIRTRPAGKASAVIQPIHRKKEDKSDVSFEKKPENVEVVVKNEKIEPYTFSEKKKETPVKETTFKKVVPKLEPKVEKTESKLSLPEISVPATPTKALVEKYRPKALKDIIGQKDSNSNANKLYKWLANWHKNRKKPASKPAYGGTLSPDIFKAVLLSGPPGIGKTTTAEVVCKELGFEFIEFNASDTRSKRLLHEEVAGLLSNTTMSNYFHDGSKEKVTAKHVLIMDEVDGMSGNQDRGGVQELVSLIRSTSIPIICICNDRNNPKMRTLSKYTYDLRFPKPKLMQITAAMLSLCHKEGIEIAKQDLEQLIVSTDQDIRQVINHLAMHGAGAAIEKDSSYKTKHKDIRLGIWDVARKVFSAEDHKNMSIHDKSDLFFHDYNIAPLFVQENYLSVVPNAPQSELLSRIAEAADSIAIGDLVESAIRTNNAWSLLPTQAMFSSVIPGTLLSGRINAQIGFPNWLGRNSKRGKLDRMLQEITAHSRMTTGASKEAINLDYSKHLRDKIVRPLVLNGSNGVQESIDAMNAYHLLREDMDNLIEVSLWPGDRDPMQSIESKTKAAFTRAYNKSCMAHSYSTGGVSKKKKGAAQEDEVYGAEEDEDDGADEEEEDDINNDKMIKAKKPTASKPSTSKTSAAKPASTKGGTRGRGRGRGKA